jgi:hypothetical protein
MLSVDGTRTTEWFCKIGREIWEKQELYQKAAQFP